MIYDWEKRLKPRMEKWDAKLPDRFRLVGIAVENIETGEAALIFGDEYLARDIPPHDVTSADVAQDIMGDANSNYNRVFSRVFRTKPDTTGSGALNDPLLFGEGE